MLTLPTHAADVLAGFFASAESDAGMRSTFGAFVALAQSGVRCDGGTKDHEINVTDRRYGWRGEDGEVRTGTAGRSRSVWKALRLLSGDVQNVLYAAHGPTDWAKLVDASFGRGTATKLTKLVGPHLGVALLTPTVAKGLAEALAKAEEQAINDLIEASREMLGVPDGWSIRNTDGGFTAPAGAAGPADVVVAPAVDMEPGIVAESEPVA